jgi:3-dehydroquinate dehydratase-1
MATTKRIAVDGKAIAGGKLPVVCAPLVGTSRAALLEEAAVVAAKEPDVVEWRVDFFDQIGARDEVVAVARELKRIIRDRPLLFTRRSAVEGGRAVPISEDEVLDVYAAVCGARCVDLVDYELSNPAMSFARVRDVSRAHGIALVASFHDFARTPPAETLRHTFAAMERAGADVAKVAVMPKSIDDVLALMTATLQADRELRIPVIGMSMGPEGALTRIAGWMFGSTLTFAVGKGSSAPGQVAIDDLRTAIEILSRALGAGSARG